nr:alpha-E domain-containing protein [Cytophagales bacterium]
RVGRFLERADKISRFVDVKYFILLPDAHLVGSPLDILQWSSVLKSASAYNMFRQQYREINPVNIVEFLVLDKLFPRSVLHSLIYAETSLREISGTSSGSRYSNAAEKQLSQLRAEIEFTSVAEIFDIGLHEFIDRFQDKNNDVSQKVFDTFFALKTA